ncbi:O-linked N-acetylglucosamine transferase, SPINDLY family protein [Selenomonas sp. F0473]|uniref:O-linked N-acetylglucosamine transferase, SPINDLY family protein n=1 Tax=Selenomonas sp. F0473 TaxID=999423 RepID=UPI0025FF1692|nr:glycosyl transferase family 41 [Selenomonas sp. F0473]
MSWMEDYGAIREDIHTGYIYEAIEAILHMRRNNEIPDDEQWRFSEMMGACCGALADTEGALASYFEAATEDKFLRSQREHFSNYLYLCHAVPNLTTKELKAQFDMYATLYRREEPLAPRENVQHERLRIGFIAPHFLDSSSSLFYAGLMRGLREKYDVYAYALSDRADDFTEALRTDIRCASLENISIEEQAERIRADEIDVLVDLGGHTEGGMTLMVLARRPAPVQISGIGWFATTGVPFVDGFLTDDVLSPAGTEEFYSEELLRLPHAFVMAPTDVMRAAPIAERPEGEPVTFGVLQNFMKINESVLAVWARILKKVPKSRLVLQDAVDSPLRVTTILEMLDGMKLPMKRIFVRRGKKDYLADYGDIDIALDTFPYAGGASTATALYMGVPVVSLRGETHASRLGASVLTAAGHPEWIGADERAYEEIAVNLAARIDEVRAGRAALRAAVETSPLTDETAYLRAAEETIARFWAARGDFAL